MPIFREKSQTFAPKFTTSAKSVGLANTLLLLVANRDCKGIEIIVKLDLPLWKILQHTTQRTLNTGPSGEADFKMWSRLY